MGGIGDEEEAFGVWGVCGGGVGLATIAIRASNTSLLSPPIILGIRGVKTDVDGESLNRDSQSPQPPPAPSPPPPPSLLGVLNKSRSRGGGETSERGCVTASLVEGGEEGLLKG